MWPALSTFHVACATWVNEFWIGPYNSQNGPSLIRNHRNHWVLREIDFGNPPPHFSRIDLTERQGLVGIKGHLEAVSRGNPIVKWQMPRGRSNLYLNRGPVYQHLRVLNTKETIYLYSTWKWSEWVYERVLLSQMHICILHWKTIYKFNTKTRGDIHPISAQLILDSPEFKKETQNRSTTAEGLFRQCVFARPDNDRTYERTW